MGVAEAEARMKSISKMGLPRNPSALFLAIFTMMSFTAMARPKPAVSWMNSLAPVLWNSSI